MGPTAKKKKSNRDKFCKDRYQSTKVLRSRMEYELYEAQDTLYRNSRVLIQVMDVPTSISSEERSLLKITLETLQSIEARNLFVMEDFELTDDRCVLVNEQFDSLSLEEYAATNPGQSTLLLIFFQVILAVVELHKRSILHANLRPNNIFVGIGGLTKLGGVTMLRNSPYSHISRSLFLGTPGYSPPEVWERDTALDERVDIYSLGSLLYFCVTEGQHPKRVLSSSRIPNDFREIILKARQPQANERFKSVKEFEDQLLSLLGGSQTIPMPDIADSHQQSQEVHNETNGIDAQLNQNDFEIDVQADHSRIKNSLDESPLQPINEEPVDVPQELLGISTSMVANNRELEDFRSPDSIENRSEGIPHESDHMPEQGPQEHSAKQSVSNTKAEENTREPETKSDTKVMVSKLKIQALIENFSDKLNQILGSTVVLAACFLILLTGIGIIFIRSSSTISLPSEPIVESPSRDFELKIVGKPMTRTDALGEWKSCDDNKIKDLDYLYARDGDAQLILKKFQFKLDFKQSAILRVIRLNHSKTASKSRMELELEEGELVFQSEGTKLFTELIDGDIRANARQVTFKVKKQEDASIYFVKSGSLSLQLPNQKQLETIYAGQKLRLESGKIVIREKLDVHILDF